MFSDISIELFKGSRLILNFYRSKCYQKIVMDDDEMDDLETNYNSYKNLKAVFLNQDVLLSTSQERMLQNVDTFIIPDYYFDFELREAGELW